MIKALFNKSIFDKTDYFATIGLTCVIYCMAPYQCMMVLLELYPTKAIKMLYYLFLSTIGVVIYYPVLICTIKKKKFVIITYGVFFAFYFFSYLFYPENRVILPYYAKLAFAFCIPAFVLGYNLSDHKLLLNSLNKLAIPSIMIALLYVYLAAIKGYNMWLGYYVLLPAMVSIFFVYNLKRKRIYNSFIVVFAFFIILLKGSRSPLYIFLAYLVICQVLYRVIRIEIPDTKEKGFSSLIAHVSPKGFIGLILMVILIILFFLSLKYISSFLDNLVISIEKMPQITPDSHSRTMDMIQSGDAFNLSGRGEYYSTAIELIKERPIIGYGICGDNIQIGKILGANDSSFSGSYAHNLFLGVLLNMGIPIGIAFLSFFCYCVIRYLKMNWYSSGLVIILVVLAGLELMISNSFLKLELFWLLFGLVFYKKKTIETEMVDA